MRAGAGATPFSLLPHPTASESRFESSFSFSFGRLHVGLERVEVKGGQLLPYVQWL